MKHSTEPPAPLFNQSKGFNYREVAAKVKPEIVERLGLHPRQEAMDAVAAGRERFIALASDFLCTMPGEFTGEDALARAGEVGLVADEPKVWGVVFNRLARAGRIVKTGEFRSRANGNPTPVWRVNAGGV